MLRRLPVFWARIRDLAFIALAVQHFLSGLAGWVTLASGLAFATAVVTAMATAAATHAKAVSTENRVNDLVPTVASLNQGQFTAVPGGAVTLTGTVGAVTLHVGALANFTGGPNTAFLAGLSKLNHLSGQPTDNNTGSTWATGERGYINNCVAWINNIDADLQNKGWMS